jgi:hypothetical protein
VYQRLFRIIDTVGAKTLSQTDRYSDERVDTFASNLVAPQGRRLTRGVKVGSVVVTVGIIGFWVWSFVSDAIEVIGN